MSGQNLMASSTIVDTDIIIDVGRGIPERLTIYSKSKSITISIQKGLTVRSPSASLVLRDETQHLKNLASTNQSLSKVTEQPPLTLIYV
jgi:hypothetical protein